MAMRNFQCIDEVGNPAIVIRASSAQAAANKFVATGDWGDHGDLVIHLVVISPNGDKSRFSIPIAATKGWRR